MQFTVATCLSNTYVKSCIVCVACCILPGSPDEPRVTVAGSASKGDGNVEADGKEIDVEHNEAQKVGATQAHNKDLEQDIEKKDTTAVGGTEIKKTVISPGEDAGDANDNRQQKADEGDKQANKEEEQDEGDDAETEDKKPAQDTQDENEDADDDRAHAYDNINHQDDAADTGDDAKAGEGAVGGDQNDQRPASDAKSGPEKTSGKDAYNDDDINFYDNRQSDKNVIPNKASRAGDNSEDENDDNLYNDDGEADEQDREPSNRLAEDDNEDEQYVADDDTGYGADEDEKDANHVVYEPPKDAQGSDVLRSTLLRFQHVLCMLRISRMLFFGSSLYSCNSWCRNCPWHDRSFIFQSLNVRC